MTQLTITTNAQLFAITKTFDIKDKQLSKLVNTSADTVKKWRLPIDTKGRRNVSSTTLQCLKLAIFCYQTTPMHLLLSSGVVDVDTLSACNVPRIGD